LYCCIMSDQKLKCVQNAVLFFCVNLLLREEFFIDNVDVTSVLLENASEFSHLFQSTLSIAPNPVAWRQVILDDNAWIDFCKLCYVQDNNNGVGVKRERPQVEENETILAHGRRLLAELVYRLNAYRPEYEKSPDLYQKDSLGRSCFGYVINSQELPQVIGEFPYKIDSVYRRHFITEKKKRLHKKRLKKKIK